MLAAQRWAKILEELDRSSSVRVSDLVSVLGVSDMTVRRDLDALQGQGALRKVHGGAVRSADADPVQGGRSTHEPGFLAKSTQQQAEKESISACAAAMVEPGSAIAVSAGTTTHALAPHLVRVPELTVVTNSVRLAVTMYSLGRSDLTVLLTGGLRTPSDALVGPLAIGSLRSLHTDVVFMGVHGMDPDTGLTTPNLMESETNRALVGCSRRMVVLADSTKWRVLGLSSFASLADADTVVTDCGVPDEARGVLEEQVGSLVVVDPHHRDLPPSIQHS